MIALRVSAAFLVGMVFATAASAANPRSALPPQVRTLWPEYNAKTCDQLTADWKALSAVVDEAAKEEKAGRPFRADEFAELKARFMTIGGVMLMKNCASATLSEPAPPQEGRQPSANPEGAKP